MTRYVQRHVISSHEAGSLKFVEYMRGKVRRIMTEQAVKYIEAAEREAGLRLPLTFSVEVDQYTATESDARKSLERGDPWPIQPGDVVLEGSLTVKKIHISEWPELKVARPRPKEIADHGPQ